ncbi:MAG TPA: hypothetical protein VN902_16990 [Candidatus Acidoferrales bacterium]|jgi:hypothetical protein|nr:hypothetical protein [Candidatus Acidoferrales bacterium]
MAMDAQRGAAKCVWTLVATLHITAEMPLRANQVRENNMAKKLKKAKKIEPTKPLMKR